MSPTTSARSDFVARWPRRSWTAAARAGRGSPAAARSLNSSCGREIHSKIWSGSAVYAESSPSGLKATKLAAPTRISGAVSPIARDRARMTPVAIPGIAAGRTCLPDRLPLRRAERHRALADRRRHRPDRLARGDDHDREHEQPEGEAAGEHDAAELERAAHQERQAEDSVDDRRDGGEVLDVHLDEAVPPPVAVRRTPRGRSPSPRPPG